MPGRSYGRTFDLLAALAEHRAGVSSVELARRLKIPRSTLSLMLQHFHRRNLTTLADDGRSVVIGPELIKLAFRIVASFDMRRVVRPELEWLANETREDVYLGVRYGLEVIYIDRVEGVESIRLTVELGAPRPLHSTALGKLVLAYSRPELLDSVIAGKGLARRTSRTFTERTALAAELAGIRRHGYAIGDGENVEEIAAIAVPIFGYDGAVAGISLATLRSRGLANRDRLIPKMLAAAERINRRLGTDGGDATAPHARRRDGRAGPSRAGVKKAR